MMKSLFALVGLTLGLGCTTAFAQKPTRTAPSYRADLRAANTPRSAVSAAILQAEQTQNADALLLAYGQAVTDADLARQAIAQLLSSYYALRNQAVTAEQATQAVAEANLRFQVLQAAQNQIMVQQNQQILQQNAQIIALLQQSARTR